MSQKKVDEYKNYKKNRRENIKKEKRKERLTMAAMWGAVVVFIACVGGAMGVSIYNKYQAKQAALPTYGSTSFILSDMAGIQKEDTEDHRICGTGYLTGYVLRLLPHYEKDGRC